MTRSEETNFWKEARKMIKKPQVDDRLYRSITLPNKLQALLVSDPETDKASAALDVGVGTSLTP